MREVVFFLEEASAKELLQGILPLLVPKDKSIACRFVVFEGKQDLDSQLERKLRGYLNSKAVFIVMRDQDAAPNCAEVKKGLIHKCTPAKGRKVRVCIACRALETFYLADLAAVERGLGISGLGKKQGKAKFRNPDYLHSPDRELQALTGSRYQKVSGSRAIAPHLDLSNTRSPSFAHLVRCIREALNMLLPAGSQ